MGAELYFEDVKVEVAGLADLDVVTAGAFVVRALRSFIEISEAGSEVVTVDEAVA
jgi:hypothetical protein